MSIRARDLSRWPMPATAGPQLVRLCLPVERTWEVMPIHLKWLEASTRLYAFDDVAETLRHLIYVANSEPPQIKKLIFRQVRCLHCHVGARAGINGRGGHEKVSFAAVVHAFQLEWLQTVREKCRIKSLEKVVRIICDYYQSRVNQARIEGGEAAAKAKETEIFGMNRENDKDFLAATAPADDGEEGDPAATSPGAEEAEEGPYVPPEDPDACTQQEAADAIRRCLVGRNSSSYAVALGETAEETRRRRAKEEEVENSEEARRYRAMIRKTKVFLG